MKVAWLAACAALAVACGRGTPGATAPPPEVIAKASAELTAYLDAAYEAELQMSPEALTWQGRTEQYDTLDDRSEAEAARRLAWRRQSVAGMKARFDPAVLTEEARTSFDIWALELERSEREVRFRRHYYVFGRNGDHAALPNFLINQHRVASKADLEAYISRVGRVGAAIDQDLERAKLAAADGIRMPAFAYDSTLSENTRLLTGAPFTKGPDSALLADTRAKALGLVERGLITRDEARALTDAAADAMTARMAPAYARLNAWLVADRPHADVEPRGVGALPDGAAFYQTALAIQTTTGMTADEVHALGLREVARIRAEMERVKAEVGFAGSLAEFFTFLRTDPRFYLPNTEAGREQYLALARGHLAAMKAKLPEYFAILPKADLVVKRVEAFREEPGGAQHYFSGSPDGSRPGIFYAHLSDMRAMPVYQLENIAYHEGLPGHHMQISIAQELTGIPKFRTQYGYTAYLEGWGLYAEALAREMGFDADPYSNFGRLSSEMWRAIRLVLDTGIHAKGWSEAQAVAYFTENSPQAESSIRSEVRRYITTPGQATAYKIGMLTLQELRDRARRELGPRFSYPAFHTVVLAGGSLPLPVLEARVTRWIAREKAGAAASTAPR